MAVTVQAEDDAGLMTSTFDCSQSEFDGTGRKVLRPTRQHLLWVILSSTFSHANQTVTHAPRLAPTTIRDAEPEWMI